MNKKSPFFAATLALALLFTAHPSDSQAKDRLILGLYSYLSATELYERFSPLVDHLSRELKMPVRIHTENNYENHATSLRNGDIDIAFMGPAL